jgi:hypothetical protein
LLGAALVVAGVALPARGQGALEWKFKEGEKFYVEVVTQNKQSVEIAGKKTPSDSTITTVYGFEVVKQGPEGTVLKQTIEGVRVKSDDPTAAVAARGANQAKGVAFQVTLAPSGKLLKFEGYADLIRKIGGSGEAGEKAARTLIPEEALKEELARIFGFLPDKPVSSGATWSRDELSSLGPGGTLTGKVEYTFKGKAEGGESITFTRSLAYAPPKEAAGGVKLTKAEAKVDQAGGSVVFDAAAGRLVRQESSLHLKGNFTIDDGTRVTATAVDQTTTQTIRLLDKNPLEEPAKP